MSNKMLVVHRDDFLRIGAELFGKDPTTWRFRCVQCGHEQSHEEAVARNPNIGDSSSWIFCACEGRHTNGVGCNWTLGALFRIHTLEVFDPKKAALTPSFEFAHPNARALLETAAKSFSTPQHPTTDARVWSEYVWPEWIPEDVRKQIEEFWCESWGRSPRMWLDDARRQGAPVLGSRVTLQELGGKTQVEGRYVHCWNNIGRLVLDDGSVAWVSF